MRNQKTVKARSRRVTLIPARHTQTKRNMCIILESGHLCGDLVLRGQYVPGIKNF